MDGNTLHFGQDTSSVYIYIEFESNKKNRIR